MHLTVSSITSVDKSLGSFQESTSSSRKRKYSESDFRQYFSDAAKQTAPGTIAFKGDRDLVYLIGKTFDEKLLVLTKGDQIGFGNYCKVFAVFNKLNALDEFVLKVYYKEDHDFNLDNTILQAVHSQGLCPYVVASFAARAIPTITKNSCVVLQKREGLDLSVLSQQENRPSVSFIVEALKKSSDSLQAMGWKDLDQKPENYVLSADGERIVKIDVNGFFQFEDFITKQKRSFIFTCEHMPIEGFYWFDLLIRTKQFLECNWDTSVMYAKHGFFIEPGFQKRLFSVLKIPVSSVKEEICDILTKEQRKTIDRIMTYQLGLTAYLYITRNKEKFPYGNFVLPDVGTFQRISHCSCDEIESYSFKTPSDWHQLSLKIQTMIQDWLNPHPFLEMSEKYALLKNSRHVTVNPLLSLDLNSIGDSYATFSTANNIDFWCQREVSCYVSKPDVIGSNKDLIAVCKLSSQKFIYLKDMELKSFFGFSSVSFKKDIEMLLEREQKKQMVDYIVSRVPVAEEKIENLVRAAFGCLLGGIKKYYLPGREFVVGKILTGDVLIGFSQASIAECGKVFHFFDYLNKHNPDQFILKRGKRAELEREHRVLTVLHGDKSCSYLADFFAAVNFREEFVLQTNAGKRLSALMKQEDRPHVDLLLECVEEFYARMQEKGVADLSVRLQDFMYSSKKEKIIKVNCKKSFFLDEVRLDDDVAIDGFIPIEGIRWLTILQKAYKDQESGSFLNATMQVLGVSEQSSLEEKQSCLQEKYKDTIQKMMLFQKGSIVFEYLSKEAGTCFFPLQGELVEKDGTKKFPKITQNIEGQVAVSADITSAFWKMDAVSEQVLSWLNAEPFVEMEKQTLAVLSATTRTV